jgi:ribosomal-protein-alanine N-acetyltransferase
MNIYQMDIQETIIIRQMQLDDIPAVQEIDRQSFSLPWPQRAFEFELNENPGSLLWVAEIDEPENKKKVVGMVVVWLIIDEAHIATIATSPEYRRREIAKMLIATALKSVVELKIQTATLEVRANNTPAINLYHSFGFKIAGIRPHYYLDNREDALIMTLNRLDRFQQNNYFESWLNTNKGGRL